MRPLILVGGGGHCKSVIEAAESAGFTIEGILDLPENVGGRILGYPVIGTDDDIPRLVSGFDFIVTLGFIKDPYLRIRLHEKVEDAGGRFATVIASTAHVSRHAMVRCGTVVLHHACVNAGASIGKGCIINTFANIEHDAVIGDYCHVSTGAMVNGGCRVGEGTFLGSQSVMVNGMEIAAGCVIAAGSMVRKNLFQKGVYSGNPSLLKIKL
ncbi:acetyltransferase [uncultured Bacteroides sp.]|uniref:acetyltransferase n=1 Tax=uncultured Bacteroides sp. TaxID=162156 RepID=UPI0025D6671C|nr:acetyltransferase [uncultured Bacteroides sp.]